MKVDDFFREWTGQRPNLCTAFHEAGIEAMAFAEAYHKQQVKLLVAPDVSKSEGIEREALLKLKQFVANQKDLPDDINQIVNDNFWELF